MSEKKIQRIPVTWQTFGYVEIEADTVEEAVEKFRASDDPDSFQRLDGEYVLNSIRPAGDDDEIVKALWLLRSSKSALEAEEENEKLDIAKHLILSFCRREYDSAADFSDLSRIPVAYTTTEDTEENIEVFLDLVNYRLIQCLDGDTVNEVQYDSIEQMTEECLKTLDFDDLVRLSDLD